MVIAKVTQTAKMKQEVQKSMPKLLLTANFPVSDHFVYSELIWAELGFILSPALCLITFRLSVWVV